MVGKRANNNGSINGDLTEEEKKKLNIKEKKIMNNLISKESLKQMDKEFYKEVKSYNNNNNNNSRGSYNKKNVKDQTTHQTPGSLKQGTVITKEEATMNETYEQPTETE